MAKFLRNGCVPIPRIVGVMILIDLCLVFVYKMNLSLESKLFPNMLLCFD